MDEHEIEQFLIKWEKPGSDHEELLSEFKKSGKRELNALSEFARDWSTHWPHLSSAFEVLTELDQRQAILAICLAALPEASLKVRETAFYALKHLNSISPITDMFHPKEGETWNEREYTEASGPLYALLCVWSSRLAEGLESNNRENQLDLSLKTFIFDIVFKGVRDIPIETLRPILAGPSCELEEPTISSAYRLLIFYEPEVAYAEAKRHLISSHERVSIQAGIAMAYLNRAEALRDVYDAQMNGQIPFELMSKIVEKMQVVYGLRDDDGVVRTTDFPKDLNDLVRTAPLADGHHRISNTLRDPVRATRA